MAETAYHKDMSGSDIHAITRWVVADVASLPTTVAAADLHKVAYVQASKMYYSLVNASPVEWVALGASDENPVTALEVVGSDLVVTFADESTETIALPSGGGSVDATSLQVTPIAGRAGTGVALLLDEGSVRPSVYNPILASNPPMGSIAIDVSSGALTELRVVSAEAKVGRISFPIMSSDPIFTSLGIESPDLDNLHGWILIPWNLVAHAPLPIKAMGQEVATYGTAVAAAWDATAEELVYTVAPGETRLALSCTGFADLPGANICAMRLKVKASGYTDTQLIAELSLDYAMLSGMFHIEAEGGIVFVDQYSDDPTSSATFEATAVGDGEHVYITANFGDISDFVAEGP